MQIENEIIRVLETEAAAITGAISRVGADFVKAVKLLKAIKGKVVITGVGKSGLIGQKIAATLSSTGTASVYLHSTEAAHGDLGIITSKDAVIIISQSGETDEVLGILTPLERLKVPLISITGRKDSTLAKKSWCVLDSYVKEEACPLGLAPTASTTVQLAIGDAVAVALLKLRGFKKEDFAQFHPAGALGKKLLLKVRDLMHTGGEIPAVPPTVTVKEALFEMTKKRFGCTAVISKSGKMEGVFTDGDLRRLVEKHENPYGMKIKAVMTLKPASASAGEPVIQALAKMEEKKITVLLVTGKNGRIEGILHLHDVLKSGVV